jgi:hypothetical protein
MALLLNSFSLILKSLVRHTNTLLSNKQKMQLKENTVEKKKLGRNHYVGFATSINWFD